MGLFDFFNASPSEAQFHKIFVSFLRKNGISGDVTVVDSMSLKVEHNGPHSVNLSNFYRDYCSVKKGDRIEVLKKSLALFHQKGLPAVYADTKINILPAIRSKATFEDIRWHKLLSGEKSLKAHPFREFSSDAVITLVADTEDTIQLLSEQQLLDWNITFDQALTDALENLRDRTTDNFAEIAPGLKVGEWGDSYDSTRILLSDLAYRAGCGVDPVIMIPSRGRILVTSSSNTQAQSLMIDLAQVDLKANGRRISGLMYRFKDGMAVEYWPAEIEIRKKLAQFNQQLRVDDYESQKEYLIRFNETNQQDAFIASYTAVTRGDDSVISYSVWTEGVSPTLLPQTDYVVLVSLDKNNPHDEKSAVSKFVAWNNVMEVAGGLLERLEHYPPRYRITDFPSADQCASLKEVKF